MENNISISLNKNNVLNYGKTKHMEMLQCNLICFICFIIVRRNRGCTAGNDTE